MTKKANESWQDYQARVLDPVSPSFCATKWLDSTIWLGHGATASCHLPPAHKIQLEELAANPSALHNTVHKKKMRKLMLEGHQPSECDYCWRIEGINRNNISDRAFKSSRYDQTSIDQIATMPWDADVHLETLEIAFNRTCNFACSYCNAGFSTTWGKDINTHGAYQNLISDGAGAFQHNGAWAEPYGKRNEGNPYIEAFWKWWPELSKTLKQLRITGGEPLMSIDVWKLFDFFEQNGTNGVQFAINSNLGCKPELIDRLIEKSHAIPNLQIFSSNEAFGAQAEYIRDGIVFDTWKSNVEKVLTHGNVKQLTMMMTINNLCLFSLPEFLDVIIEWKQKFGSERVRWSANIVRFPSFMSPLVLPPDLLAERYEALVQVCTKLKTNTLVSSFEIENIQRLADYLDAVKTPHPGADEMGKLQRDFKSFHAQYDVRRSKSLAAIFPTLSDWLATVEDNNCAHAPLIDGSVV